MPESVKNQIDLKSLIVREQFRIANLFLTRKTLESKQQLTAALSCLAVAATFADSDPSSSRRSIANARRLTRSVKP